MSSSHYATFVNVSFGVVALTSGFLVLLYKKYFRLYKGVFILLFAMGVSACATGVKNIYSANILTVLYFFSRSVTPLFLMVFSEYILKLRFHILVKLTALSVTWIFVIWSFFQKDYNDTAYSYGLTVLFLIILFHILFKLISNLISMKESLVRKYYFIFIATITILLLHELLKLGSGIRFNSFSDGISAFIVTHGIILIMTSGGNSQIRQKLPILLSIGVFSIILCGMLKLVYSEIDFKYLFAVLILSVSLYTIHYVFGEVAKNPRSLGSAMLLSRLLNLPLHDKDLFIKELREWEEVNALHFVSSENIEGNSSDFNALLGKTGRCIHKYQVAALTKVLASTPGYISGIEVAKFYFKKFDCESIFQISEKGDFLAVQYMKGLNPALYSNELSVMSKIVFSTSAGQKLN